MGEILSEMRKKAVLFVVVLVMIAAIFPVHKVYAATGNEQTPSVVVSDYDSLEEAINSVEDGAIIGIDGVIELNADYEGGNLYRDNGTITIMRMTNDACIKINGISGCHIEKIVFDGNSQEFPNAMPMLQVIDSMYVNTDTVDFVNCSNNGENGGAVFIENSLMTFQKTSFTNNVADFGGHIYVRGDSEVTIQESSLQYGDASNCGGAVYVSEGSKCKIINSEVINNKADLYGGGIYCADTAWIYNTLIYGNQAKAGADIVNENPEKFTILWDDRDSLYSAKEIKPKNWVNDYVAGAVELPESIVSDKENCLMKMEYSSIYDTEESEDEESNNEQEIETDENIPDIIVSDYQALIEAENNANDGEIIGIRGEILIDSKYAVIIGQSFKKNRVTFLRMTEDSCIKIRNTNVARIRFVKFDGNRDKFPDAVPILQIENSDGIGISYVDFENCSNLSSDGGAVLVKDRANVDFDNCFFNNNLANNGGHICVKDSACVYISYANFVNGEAVNNGGAVYTENEGQLKIKNSVVKENVANELGGGIYNAGSINIDGTIVYANRAKAGADIANENPENMIYQVPDDHFIYENEHIQFVQWISDYDSEVVNAPDSENFLMKMEYKTIQDNQESEENENEQEPENGNEQGNQGNTDSDEGIADNDNNTAADDSNNNDNTAADSATDSTPDSTNDSDSSSENQDSSNQENVNEGDSEKNPEDVSDSDSNSSDSESSNTGDNADTENQEQQNNSNDSQDDNQSENNNQSDNSNQADNEQSEENRQQSDEGQQSNDNQSNSNNQANTENQESNDNQSNDVSGSNNVGQNENTSTNDNSSSGNGQSDSSDNVNQGGVDKGTENTPSIPSNSTNTESEGKNPVEKTDNSITDSKPNEESKAEDSGDKADDKAELNSKPDDNTATDTHDSIKTESKEDTSSTSKPDKVTTPKKTTKVIKTIKATAKKGKKVVSGTTLKKATVKVKIGKKTYKVKSDSKGKYKIKLKSKLKKGTKITITVSKKGYKTKSKSLKVK